MSGYYFRDLSHLLCLFWVLSHHIPFINDRSSSNDFTIKQCELEEFERSCNPADGSILIAIDGTGSRLYYEENSEPERYESEIGVNNNQQWIWQSHIANFWEDYQGESHYYFGPDANEMFLAGEEIHEIVSKSKQRICHFLNNYVENHDLNDVSSELIHNMTLNGGLGIDIIGYSRGGFAAMDLSRKLQKEGCEINDIVIKPIAVRWMGLYDPVERDIDFDEILVEYNEDEIAENVQSVSIAERSEFIHSRSYFGNAVNKKVYYKNRISFNSSHSGIGGQPGKGDCKEIGDSFIYWFTDIAAKLCSPSYKLSMDKESSIKTDIWMRNNAINAKVPIQATQDEYYGDLTDFTETE
eukprot:132791_1